jgi:hypothetical protein
MAADAVLEREEQIAGAVGERFQVGLLVGHRRFSSSRRSAS